MCEGISIARLAARFGTPTYVYSRAAILEEYRHLRQGLSQAPGLICYSVKANSNLAILKLLREEGAGFDIVSGGELARVERIGADPGRIVYSGVGKTADEIVRGLDAGILMFNVESAGELELIDARAKHLGKCAGVSLRINPDVPTDTHPYIATGRVIHKFGIPKPEVRELYGRAAHSAHLKIRGVTCHIGSQIISVEPFMRAFDELMSIANTLRGDGLPIEILDLGGGFGVRYAREQPFDLQRLTGELTRRLAGTPYQLILEPGRMLVAAAGILVTRVLYVKRNEQKNFVVVDAGMNDLLRPTLYGSYHEIVPVEQRPLKNVSADIVGPLCETGDFLAQDRVMPDAQPGDLLAILTVGAYGFAQASNYNSRPRPAEVLVDGAKVELIRRRESVDDLMALEQM
jgi:diaminopimelate decarboxylase